MSPKPVYEALKKLIHQEWTTRTAGASNAAGQFAFRGFRGQYQVSVDVNGATVQKPFELGKGDRQELVISLGKWATIRRRKHSPAARRRESQAAQKAQ